MDYSTIKPNKELRKAAREQLHGAWGQMALAFFILFLTYLPYLVFAILHELNPQVSAFAVLYTIFYIALLIIAGPLYLGVVGYFLKRLRGEDIHIKNIFDGFQNFLKAFLLMFFTSLLTLLWSLLLLIPGIIKVFSYSMAFFILHDNPEMKPLEALTASRNMMNGHKADLFSLTLSFIGWMLLATVPLCLGYFWLYPYMGMSIANFYENLKISQQNPS
jgi:uncharacterized membrane protein